MKVYLAGPMRGLPDWNFPAFDAAEERWLAAGHQPFNPAQIDRVLQYGPGQGENPSHLRHVIQMDLACLFAADALALLPGWERSTGAAAELALVQFLGLPVYDAVTMERLHPPARPWAQLPPSRPTDGDVWHATIRNGEHRWRERANTIQA